MICSSAALRFLVAALPLVAGLARAQDPVPPMLELHRSATGLDLSWSSAGTGWDYSLQYREALADAPWLLAPPTGSWPLSGTAWFAAPDPDAPARFFRLLAVPHAERGKLLSASLLSTQSIPEVNFLMTLAGVPITAQYAVEVYKLIYETIDPWGARTTASGVLTVPRNVDHTIPLLSYQHGTLVQPSEAPSANPLEQIPGIGFAGVGYATTLPDFLGLGDSPGRHPYHHARSEATAALDLLRAARTWCATNSLPLTNQLFLCGYSQGGHATLALHRELEQTAAAEFRVVASAPMAGAYDLAGVTADDFFSGRPMPNPYYFPYLLAAYQDVYQLTNDLAQLLAAPYDTTLPPLLARRASGSELNAILPNVVTNLIKPEVLAAVRANPRHPLRLALRENSLLAWTPVAPLHLYHCDGDEDVLYANSAAAYQAFRARGATQVELMNPQAGADHGGCARPSFLAAKAWFDTFK